MSKLQNKLKDIIVNHAIDFLVKQEGLFLTNNNEAVYETGAQIALFNQEDQQKTTAYNFTNTINSMLQKDYGITLNEQEKNDLSKILFEAGKKMGKEIQKDPSLKKELGNAGQNFEEQFKKPLLNEINATFNSGNAIKKATSSIHKEYDKRQARKQAKGFNKIVGLVMDFFQSIAGGIAGLLSNKAKETTDPKEKIALEDIKDGVQKLTQKCTRRHGRF